VLTPLTLQELKGIETSVLIDMLAQETDRFSQLFRIYFSIKNNQEYQGCKENIQYLLAELNNRKSSSKEPGTTISTDADQTNSAKITSLPSFSSTGIVYETQE
jgi:hypothetical protein